MIPIREFQFFDPRAELTITAGHLPHWQQPGATYFITYRTSDSISQVAMDRILRSRDDWLARHGINAAQSNWHQQLGKRPIQLRETFRRSFAAELEQELDQLAGECLLQRADLAAIVSESLQRFDGERYRLAAFVVMPNHVHVLAQIFPERAMLDQCYGWKHFQAHKINQRLGRRGHFFQAESFDHLVRDEEHFWKFRRYIEQNPERAKLNPDECSLYLPAVQ